MAGRVEVGEEIDLDMEVKRWRLRVVVMVGLVGAWVGRVRSRIIHIMANIEKVQYQDRRQRTDTAVIVRRWAEMSKRSKLGSGVITPPCPLRGGYLKLPHMSINGRASDGRLTAPIDTLSARKMVI